MPPQDWGRVTRPILDLSERNRDLGRGLVRALAS